MFRRMIIAVIITCLMQAAAVSFCPVYADERLRVYDQINPSNDFTLTDYNGDPFRLKDHRGEVLLLFFGYLTCPDICPVTLSKVSRVYSTLKKKEQEKVSAVFISVDTHRDSPEKIKEYLDYFSVKSMGLTGTQDEIDAVVDDFKAWYQYAKTESALGYLIDHTAYIYLIDPNGEVKYLFKPEDNVKHIAKIIKKVIKSSSKKK